MVKFERGYFNVSAGDITDVIRYSNNLANLGEGIDDGSPSLEEMLTGKPLSNACWIHEREEIRELRRMGLDPFGPDGYDRKYYDRKHTKAIQAEFHYLKQAARDRGFNIPIPVLILFSPVLGSENREVYLWCYIQLRHDDAARQIYYNDSDAGFVVNNVSEAIVPRELQKQVKEFYKQLLIEEPKWGLLKF